MTKPQGIRLDLLEEWFCFHHDGRILLREWYENIGRNNTAFDWLWNTEVKRPTNNLDYKIIQHQIDLDTWRSAMQMWRKEREKTWKERYWSSEWDRGKRVPGSLYQHPQDPPLPSEIHTYSLFGKILASIDPEVFPWAELFAEILTPDFELKYRNQREDIDFFIDRIVPDLASLEERARRWRNKLGQVETSEINYHSWMVNARYLGHGGREY